MTQTRMCSSSVIATTKRRRRMLLLASLLTFSLGGAILSAASCSGFLRSISCSLCLNAKMHANKLLKAV